MTVLGFIVTGAIPNGSLEPGDPRRLISGIDYDGRICGVDSEVKVSIIHTAYYYDHKNIRKEALPFC